MVPDKLRNMADVLALPPIHANFFKFHEIRSIPLSGVAAHMTSSGTTGQKSQMFFDAFTIGQAREMVDRVMRARGVFGDTAHYLVKDYALRGNQSGHVEYEPVFNALCAGGGAVLDAAPCRRGPP